MYHETSAALTTAKWEADKTRGQLQGKEREKWDEWYERIENLRNEIQEYCNQKDENERKNDGNERKD
jgi:alpha-D-ribose 1-methylphosphonate 5-triphosphate diphosphatase PhnM